MPYCSHFWLLSKSFPKLQKLQCPSRSSSVSSVALSTHASVLLLKLGHTPNKQEQNERNGIL